ncbi:PLP-dependent aminotransferase family protein [Nonomuraea sp. NPDC050556]|uniref:PLP-dependent aminotransferase family protein n=1 Tax=Nonomuraea sp. NPDC050556 TaxID=3364369 RepID=UPI00379D1F5F
MTALDVRDLHPALADPALASINFLNEITDLYPEAISFAPGAPYTPFLSDLDVPVAIGRYLDYRGASWDSLLRYGATAGQINDLVAAALERDEGIRVSPEGLVVTVGCQEALFVTLRTLFADSRDVLLAVDPCYVGLIGAARVLGIDTVGVPERSRGVEARDVAAACRALRRSGRRPRALYVVPDFANPSGKRLDLSARQALLAIAAEHDILLIEDNPYGFTAGEPLPVLKALDTEQRVIYLGTFAKVLAPGVRVGFAVADQPVTGANGDTTLLAAAFASVKSMITVNTPPMAQAAVGGALLAGFGLRNEIRAEHYRDNLAVLTAALRDRLPAGVTQNVPSGGFFAMLSVPFEVDDAVLIECARDFGVLFTPMRDFHLNGGGTNEMRLSCSNLTPPVIEEGVDRLSWFLRSRC